MVAPAPVGIGEVGGHLLDELGQGLSDGGRGRVQLKLDSLVKTRFEEDSPTVAEVVSSSNLFVIKDPA